MAASSIPMVIGVSGFSYYILSLQVSNGYPPFYEKGNSEEETEFSLPYMASLFVMMAACVFFPIFIGLIGLFSGWMGIRVRKCVRKRKKGPLPWLLNPLIVGVCNRWPMLVFDAWTIGFSASIGLLMLA